jgi:hypothetical protein
LVVRTLGLRLRGWIGAYSFMNSHGLPASVAGELRLGRVRCLTHRTLPVENQPLAIGS